jgi:hypothetical protein
VSGTTTRYWPSAICCTCMYRYRTQRTAPPDPGEAAEAGRAGATTSALAVTPTLLGASWTPAQTNEPWQTVSRVGAGPGAVVMFGPSLPSVVGVTWLSALSAPVAIGSAIAMVNATRIRLTGRTYSRLPSARPGRGWSGG